MVSRGSQTLMFFDDDDGVKITAASRGVDNMVRLWYVGTGAARGTFTGPSGGGIVCAVAFSPDGGLLASGVGGKLARSGSGTSGQARRAAPLRALQVVGLYAQ